MKNNTKMNIYYTTATIVCLTGAMLTGCADRATESVEATTQLRYTKDKRTGFCFASYLISTNAGTMTMVPCSAEVEQIIHGDIK